MKNLFISLPQSKALRVLGEAGEKASTHTIASEARLTPSELSGVLEELAGRGWVLLKGDLATLTAEGHKAAVELRRGLWAGFSQSVQILERTPSSGEQEELSASALDECIDEEINKL